MARFIDSDKLIWQVQNNDKYGTITKQVFISLLQNSETEDVVPVIHAHWRENEEFPVYNCSNCCDAVPWEWVDNYMINCCPYCGAKMDEE